MVTSVLYTVHVGTTSTERFRALTIKISWDKERTNSKEGKLHTLNYSATEHVTRKQVIQAPTSIVVSMDCEGNRNRAAQIPFCQCFTDMCLGFPALNVMIFLQAVIVYCMQKM